MSHYYTLIYDYTNKQEDEKLGKESKDHDKEGYSIEKRNLCGINERNWDISAKKRKTSKNLITFSDVKGSPMESRVIVYIF